MKFLYFSIKCRYGDIFLKKKTKHINFIYNRLFCCNHTCFCVCMVSVTSASRYVTSASRYQSRSSMYTRGLIPLNWPMQFQLESLVFEIHRCHCVMSFNKTRYSLLSTGSTQKDRKSSNHDRKNVDWN